MLNSNTIPRTTYAAAAVIFLFLLAVISGCTQKPLSLPTYVEPEPPPSPFPPQKAMASGDYAGFLADNQQALKDCKGEGECDVVLFNLGFVYAYSKSPYCNQAKALKYFDELVKKYPQSVWACQAKAWMDLVKRSIASDNSRRRMKDELKSKEAAINEKEATINEKEIKLDEKDAAINDLQNQIQRARDIDAEMDKKERELLK